MAKDLQKLLETRQGHMLMKNRDDAYKVFDAYINSKGRKGKVQLTFKPFAAMDVRGQEDEATHKLAINLSRRVHSYFTAVFSRPPQLWKVAKSSDKADLDAAERLTDFLNGVLDMSRVPAAQPRQASYVSGRGDCVFAVDFDDNKNEIYVRTYDPAWCYPTLDPFDVGGCLDMLISFTANRMWAEQEYGVKIKNQTKSDVQVFHYWTRDEFQLQVEDQQVAEFSREHKLGFCPFRWVFGSSDGEFAQADVRDVPALQDFYNENLLLAMDSIRKQVDKAYIAFGVNKDLTPKPGIAIGVKSTEAKLQEFPAGADADVIMQVMKMLEDGVESVSGISSSSSRGAISGVGTGAAIRNQVQAMEARNESRKAAFEDAYEMVGNYVLRVLEKKFSGESKVKALTKSGYIEASGKDVEGHYLCEAAYSPFLGMDLAQRIQASLQGYARLYDDVEAIRLAELPGVDPMSMKKRIEEMQKSQAVMAAKAQSEAQKVMQAGQEQTPGAPAPGEPPMAQGAIPQKATPAPPPSPQQMGLVQLGDVERALEAVKNRLHGTVWAVGELAVAGMAQQPLLMVSSEHDLPFVTAIMLQLHTHVLPGHPGDIPSIAVA